MAIFVAGMLLLLVAAGVTYRASMAFADGARAVAETQQLRIAVTNTYTSVLEAESAQRTFLMTGDARHKYDYVRTVAVTESRLDDLRLLSTYDAPEERQYLEELHEAVNRRLRALGLVTAIYEQQGLEVARKAAAAQDGIGAMQDVHDAIERIASSEAYLLGEREADARRTHRTTLAALACTIALAAVGLGVLLLGVRRAAAARHAAEAGVQAAKDRLQRADAELRQTNRLFDFVIDQVPAAIFVKNPLDLRLVRVNKAGEDLLGRYKEALIGKSDHDLFPPEHAELMAGKDRDALVRGVAVELAEERFEANSKSLRFLRTKRIPLRDEAGGQAALLQITHEVTVAAAAPDAADAVRTRRGSVPSGPVPAAQPAPAQDAQSDAGGAAEQRAAPATETQGGRWLASW